MKKKSFLGFNVFFKNLMGFICLGMMFIIVGSGDLAAQDYSAKLWEPVTWSYTGPGLTGEAAFDLVATATFTHESGYPEITTELFYDGGNTWKLRFTGTRTGDWAYTTSCTYSALNNKSGTITVNPADEGDTGFRTRWGNRWANLTLKDNVLQVKTLVPQFVMYKTPPDFHDNKEMIDGDIIEFFIEHGFNGFHVCMGCRWFDIDKVSAMDYPGYSQGNISATPDPDTFEALELLINEVNEAGGVVHIWAWGPKRDNLYLNLHFDLNVKNFQGGINGPVDRRLQRYIAARLGPIPGWSMGYGWDLHSFVTESELNQWHQDMQEEMGWFHFLGARSQQKWDDVPYENYNYDSLDYWSTDQYRPSYQSYLTGLENHPEKPCFWSDRFRIRDDSSPKDYDEEMTIRGLWNSTMAGGAANIWGYLIPLNNCCDKNGCASYPYPSYPSLGKSQIKTYSRFWKDRFLNDLEVDNSLCLSGGECVTIPGHFYIFYIEDATSISVDLSAMFKDSLPAAAIDTREAYQEISLGNATPGTTTFTFNDSSDWAVVVGNPVEYAHLAAGYTNTYVNGTPGIDEDILVYKLDKDGSKRWRKNYGGTYNDRGYCISPTGDNGCVVAGMTNSYVHGTLGVDSDFVVYKLDYDGTEQWWKNLGGSYADKAHSIQQTTDGGFIVAGDTQSYVHGTIGSDYDFLVYKLNSSGSKQWRKNYGGIFEDRAKSIRQTKDGGYILAGFTRSYVNGTVGLDYDFLVYRLNSSGDKQWRKNYGGQYSDKAFSIRQTADGGYIVAGFTQSYVNGTVGTDNDFLVYKLNSSGEKQWRKNYGGQYNDKAFSIQETADGGYIVAGYTQSYVSGTVGTDTDFLLYKLDANGNIQWQKNFGGDGNDYGFSIQQRPDGGYIVAGYTYSYYHGSGDSDFLVYRLDIIGSKIWRKNLGGEYNDQAYSVCQAIK